MRFYNPTPRQYESTLVDNRLPYDFLAGAIKGKQKEYDDSLAKMQAMGKEFGPVLPIDLKQAKEYENQINSTVKDYLAEVKPSDLEDPMFQRNLLKKQQELKEKGKIYEDVFKPRYEEFNKLQKKLAETKDQTQRQFYEKKIQDYLNPAGDPNLAANYDPRTKNYNPVKPPDQFEWKDYQKDLWDEATKIESNTKDLGYSIGSVDEFNKLMEEGKVEYRDAEKILGSLQGYLQIPEVAKTAAAQRNVNRGEDFNQAFQHETNAIKYIKNKKGETVPQIDTSTLLGQQLNSIITARTMQKVDKDRKIFDNFRARTDYGNNWELLNSSGTLGIDETKKSGSSADLFFDANGEFSIDEAIKNISKITDVAKLKKEFDEGKLGAVGSIVVPLFENPKEPITPERMYNAVMQQAVKLGAVVKNPDGTPNMKETTKSVYNYSLAALPTYKPNNKLAKDVEDYLVTQGFSGQNGVDNKGEVKSLVELTNEAGVKSKDLNVRDISFDGGIPVIRYSGYDKEGVEHTFKATATDQKLKAYMKPLAELSQANEGFINGTNTKQIEEINKNIPTNYRKLVGENSTIIGITDAPGGEINILFNAPITDITQPVQQYVASVNIKTGEVEFHEGFKDFTLNYGDEAIRKYLGTSNKYQRTHKIN